jgi:hypothetical protein
MNKTLGFIHLFISSFLLNAQISIEAWEGYNNAQFQIIEKNEQHDAIIIFDRTYFEAKKQGSEQVEFLQTVHRKIKINSLYGLRQFNKIYLPSVTDLEYKLELVDCKIKVLKKNDKTVNVDTSQFVESSLPANNPFYYKKDGKFKMMAIGDLNIGDEIEYIFTLKSTYNYSAYYFYKADRIAFSGEFLNLEKSLFLQGKRCAIYISPYNFTNGINNKSNFNYKDGKKISLTNIQRNTNNLYSNPTIDQPYLYYSISFDYETNEKDTWESITKDFKPKRKETRNVNIFDGDRFLLTVAELNKISSKKDKFKYLLKKINLPLQEDFESYRQVENNINIAWIYAKVLSKLCKSKKIAINFHFVVSIHNGTFDPEFVSLYQFDNILVSFLDENNETYFFSLLEPYSQLNEIKKEFQGTSCFTINQDEIGKRTFKFESIPIIEKKDLIKQNISVELNNTKSDTISFYVQEELSFYGQAWIKVKPYIMDVINDTIQKELRLKEIAKDLIVSSSIIDSVSNVSYKLDSILNVFSLLYEYNFEKEITDDTQIFAIQAELFFDNDFYTPYSLRRSRIFPGYIYDSNLDYNLTLKLSNRLTWLENTLLKQKTENSIGSIETGYNQKNNEVNFLFSLRYNQIYFGPEEWNKVLSIRDDSYQFLNNNLYFRKD